MKIRALPLIIFAISILVGAAWAANAEVLEPTAMTVADGGTINLGKIGPGQTIDLVVSGIAQLSDGGEGRWQILRVVEVPQGWQGFDSKELGTKMKAGVKAANDTRDGQYRITFRLEEDPLHQQGLGSVTFQVAVVVDRSVISASFPKERVETGVGQPARYVITLKSTSAANDVYEMSAEGVPTWSYKKSVHVPAGGTVTTFYEIVANEEKEYKPVLTIKSQSSDDIKINKELSMAVKSDVIGDIRATKNGVLVFPIVLEPLYSLLGIIGNFI
jgi:hypothetical protein